MKERREWDGTPGEDRIARCATKFARMMKNVLHHPRKFRRRSRNSVLIFRFFKLRPSDILDLLIVFLDHPGYQLIVGSPYQYAKIAWNRRNISDNVQVSILCALGLTMPILAHTIREFEGI